MPNVDLSGKSGTLPLALVLILSIIGQSEYRKRFL